MCVAGVPTRAWAGGGGGGILRIKAGAAVRVRLRRFTFAAMDLRALVAVLICLMMGEGVWGVGLGAQGKELGIADIPPCGVSV